MRKALTLLPPCCVDITTRFDAERPVDASEADPAVQVKLGRLCII